LKDRTHVHTPHFNIDENAIEIGKGMMAWLGSSIVVMKFLGATLFKKSLSGE